MTLQANSMAVSNRAIAISRRPKAGRGGVTIVEVIVSGLLLGTVMLLALPTLGWIVRERREADRRLEALTEVENLMDRLTAQEWKRITPEAAADLKISDSAARQLPGAELDCRVDLSDTAPGAKRVHIELTWLNRYGGRVAPVRLTTWVYLKQGD